MPGRRNSSRSRPAATTDPSRKLRFRTALTELAQLDKSDLDAALRRILRVDAEILDVARVSFWELAPDPSAFLATCKQPVLHKPIDFAELGRLVATVSAAPIGFAKQATRPAGL